MKRDEYGPMIESVLADSTDGLSVAEIVEGVGCSRQRVYNWVSKNRARLRTTGRTDHGATTYVIREDEAGTDGGIQIGDSMVIRSMRWHRGLLVVGLEAEDGTELIAEVSAS